MHQHLEAEQTAFQAVLDYLNQELGRIRTGRATAALVEDVPVEAYGVRTPLKQLASISIPEPKQIAIQPWDHSITRDIERALSSGDLQLPVAVDGAMLRVTLPALNEERRRELAKLASRKLEDARIALRAVRERIRATAQQQEADGAIGEDELFTITKELDQCTKDWTTKAEQAAERKSQEIMTL